MMEVSFYLGITLDATNALLKKKNKKKPKHWILMKLLHNLNFNSELTRIGRCLQTVVFDISSCGVAGEHPGVRTSASLRLVSVPHQSSKSCGPHRMCTQVMV